MLLVYWCSDGECHFEMKPELNGSLPKTTLKRKASDGDGEPSEMRPDGDSDTGLTVSFRCTKLK